jgi:hypothetical protein
MARFHLTERLHALRTYARFAGITFRRVIYPAEVSNTEVVL